jgi:hypothetical protein
VRELVKAQPKRLLPNLVLARWADRHGVHGMLALFATQPSRPAPHRPLSRPSVPIAPRRSQPVAVYCGSGLRSAQASVRLRKVGGAQGS